MLRRPRAFWAWTIAGTVILLGAIWLLAFGPLTFIGPWRGDLTAKEYLDLQNSYRLTYAQILGGIVLTIGAFLTWRTWLTNRETQITQRFSAAVAQLGSEKLEVRLGGIYALERIAWDSERDYWPVIEILTAFVRENAHWTDPTARGGGLWRRMGIWFVHLRNLEKTVTHSERVSYWGYQPLHADIQAALTVIGRRNPALQSRELQQLDLRETDLRRAHLDGANLANVNLALAHLDDARLTGASFRRAFLGFTHLKGASVEQADFSEAEALHWDQVQESYGYDFAKLPKSVLAEREEHEHKGSRPE